jgi:hypothetical protein
LHHAIAHGKFSLDFGNGDLAYGFRTDGIRRLSVLGRKCNRDRTKKNGKKRL